MKGLRDIASFLDSTNLKPEARQIDIEQLCMEAVSYKMAAVCIQPCRLGLARPLLSGSQVKLCTVIGFPLGADRTDTKICAAAKALEDGAVELDMVINVGMVKDNEYGKVGREIEAFLALKQQREYTLKVIVETALLSESELGKMTEIVSATGADYIKTSTGFSSRGVSLEDMAIINCYKTKTLKVKASGGIKNLDFALQLLQAGADRLGTSSARLLADAYRARERQQEG